VLWFYVWDMGMLSFAACGFLTERVYRRAEIQNRLFNKKEGQKPQFKGNKICVLGNGPSLARGVPCGHKIDSMDEVVRFNNFQTKVSGLEDWTGRKTTVHFSDSMLFPSYPEYAVEGSCICLSLFMDRLVVSGSYFLFRMFIDLSFSKASSMMFSPELGWLSHDDIHNLKERLGISKWKHPTSGCLAIDWMVRHRPDPTVPVYIHGFDFFQGSQIHYYSKTEPLYERLNDLLGVTVMHEPQKERAFVEQLVKEGKVQWLSDPKDRPKEGPVVPGVQMAGDGSSTTIAGKMWEGLVQINRLLTCMTYPIAAPFICLNYWPSTPENARTLWRCLVTLWTCASGSFYYFMWFKTEHWASLSRTISYFLWFWSVDVAIWWSCTSLYLTERVLRRKKCTNRLFGTEGPPTFNGDRIAVLGNGPSLAKDEPHGELINSMDEVVRFNNFQAKTGPFKIWTGTKTTVHFSDSMLYPSFPEYEVPGACVVLSLFMDRLVVSMSYFCFRMGIDLACFQAWKMMSSPALGWVPNEDIDNLKVKVGISKWKHPTSGVLAIDWFVRHRPNKNVPVYIHGFDFFEGDQVHYYSKKEPLYERLNDVIGVWAMHEPQKERAFVEKLVRDGSVKWLAKEAKDMKEVKEPAGQEAMEEEPAETEAMEEVEADTIAESEPRFKA